MRSSKKSSSNLEQFAAQFCSYFNSFFINNYFLQQKKHENISWTKQTQNLMLHFRLFVRSQIRKIISRGVFLNPSLKKKM